MKPENATLLLEESSDVAVIEEDKLKLPAPELWAEVGDGMKG
jgi:hypothetical protein